jgi:CrcB protein
MIDLLVVVGAGLGAVMRYAVGRLVQGLADSDRPWGTAVVNLTGTFALGLAVGLGADRIGGDNALDVIGLGILGGYTTFSTWMVESVRLAEEGGALARITPESAAAAVNVIGQLAAGVLLAAAGLWLGRTI